MISVGIVVIAFLISAYISGKINEIDYEDLWNK